MKIAVLGGGGVRSPFLAKSLANCAKETGIEEIVFMDTNEEKISIYGKLAKNVAERINKNLKFSLTTSLEEAVKDAEYIVTTIRVGEDKGRVVDERVALKYGVLGQETTGAGGFGMALRTVPAMIEIVEAVKKYSKPDAVVLNFTNPSGLVTQAIRDYGFDRIYGICDAPSGETAEIKSIMKYQDKLNYQCYGLNHLSWFRNFEVNGKDVTEDILKNQEVRESVHRFFDDKLIELNGKEIINEYLYLFYYRQKAVDSIIQAGVTRGETIQKINSKMTQILKNYDIDAQFEEAFSIWIDLYMSRANSYMSVESKTATPKHKIPTVEEFLEKVGGAEDGYAGVTIDFIKAKKEGKESRIVLSLPNQGAIKGLEDGDVVEVSCIINGAGVKPMAIGNVSEFQYSLISRVKYYERMAAQSILEKNRDKAIKALTAHPLVNSFDIAENIVNEYLHSHSEFTGEWL